MKPNTIYKGDCLEVVLNWEKESVDCIYMDPPFNSNKDYKSFKDVWRWDDEARKRWLRQQEWRDGMGDKLSGLREILGKGGMFSYLTYMADRVGRMHSLLKETGCLFLHCDSSASHYLKIVMDIIFKKTNFKNDIIWSYRRWTARGNKFQCMHDDILFYSKSSKFKMNRILVPPSEAKKREWESGYRTNTRTTEKGKKVVRLMVYDRDKYEANKDMIDMSKYHEVVYVKTEGVDCRDVWDDINLVNSIGKDRVDYSTQKPVKLLARIIQAGSNEGDLILDPFCGSGTTLEAAKRLNREFIGIDINEKAIGIAKKRVDSIPFFRTL